MEEKVNEVSKVGKSQIYLKCRGGARRVVNSRELEVDGRKEEWADMGHPVFFHSPKA